MAQIDKYIQHLLRFEALSLMVTSNGPVVARLSSGAEKASTQTVEHALLVAAVNESAPAAAMADIRASRMAKFQYPHEHPAVTVEVTPTPGAWKLVLTPLPVVAAPRRPSEVHPAVSVPSRPPAAQRPVPSPSRPSIPAVDRAPRVDVIRPSPQDPPRVPVADSPRLSRPDLARVTMRPESPRESSTTAPPRAPESVGERISFEPRGVERSPVATPAGDDRPGDTAAIDALLRVMARVGASDLHLATGRPPLMRLHGEIKPLPGDHGPLTAEGLRALIHPTMKPAARREYAAHNDADYAYEIPGVARFRANAMVERRGPSAVLRRIPVEIVSAEELGLSRAMLDVCDLPKGLVLVTGPTGSGKSTTLASIIDRINASRRDHIITIEDPIEFVHRNKRCLVNQREVGLHTDGFKHALRAALREDPDVVMVGELRDLETTAIAIETAETGHLVFGTLHTRTAPSTVDRVIDQFPAERQPQIRAMLADSLKAVISQTLCKRVGGGRVGAYEVLLVTPAVSNLIREGKTFQLYGVMQTSRQVGMVAQHDALCELVRTGKVEVREAYNRAYSKADLRTALHHAGISLPPALVVREG
jgi:twitching motility protein PilT